MRERVVREAVAVGLLLGSLGVRAQEPDIDWDSLLREIEFEAPAGFGDVDVDEPVDAVSVAGGTARVDHDSAGAGEGSGAAAACHRITSPCRTEGRPSTSARRSPPASRTWSTSRECRDGPSATTCSAV